MSSKRSEVGGQRSEVRGQKSEVRGQIKYWKSVAERQRVPLCLAMTNDRCQMVNGKSSFLFAAHRPLLTAHPS